MFTERVARTGVELVVAMADRLGVPLAELTDGLNVDEASLRRLEPLEWNAYALISDRLAATAGYEPLALLSSNLPEITEIGRSLMSAFVSPRLLLRFNNSLLGPMNWPMVETKYDEQGDVGYLRLRLRDDRLRDCHTFFRLCEPGIASVPCFIGHPRIPVRAETTPRTGTYWISLPPSDTIVARASRRVHALFADTVMRELEQDKARLKEAAEEIWRSRTRGLDERLEVAAQRWSLSPRQRETLAGLARGLSNKQLARELGCSAKTVESHISELLRRSGADSRLHLVAGFWRDL